MRKHLEITPAHFFDNAKRINNCSISCDNDDKEILFKFDSLDYSDDECAEIPTLKMPYQFWMNVEQFEAIISLLDDLDTARFNGFGISSVLKCHMDDGSMCTVTARMADENYPVIEVRIFGEKKFFIYLNNIFPQSTLGEIIGLFKLFLYVMRQ